MNFDIYIAKAGTGRNLNALIQSERYKKVKYVYQESPHSENKASQLGEKEER
jgi:hypothetical protein